MFAQLQVIGSAWLDPCKHLSLAPPHTSQLAQYFTLEITPIFSILPSFSFTAFIKGIATLLGVVSKKLMVAHLLPI
jgi:hypothetical protein